MIVRETCILPTTLRKKKKKKTGRRGCIPIFLIFDPDQKLWVLVRTASLIVNILSKILKKTTFFSDEIFIVFFFS